MRALHNHNIIKEAENLENNISKEITCGTIVILNQEYL